VRTAVLGLLALLSGVGALVVIRECSSRQALAIGGSLVIVGLPLLVLARTQLGSAFSVAPEAKGLVTHGLYAKIPHPMYVFLDLTLLGVCVALRQAWLLVPWAGIVLLQAWQAGREAKVLENAFGDAYRIYRRRTWW
jgi:protein-S-isoprenylcysteine O-methyltransferase Ste14